MPNDTRSSINRLPGFAEKSRTQLNAAPRCRTIVESPGTLKTPSVMSNPERERLREIQGDIFGWRRWGPYLSERAWGTVREDYSPDGNAWGFFPHDMARSKTFRWGEDGIAGICDRFQVLCFAPAFWNGCDAFLKERLYGLGFWEGNHGEDVKEYYFHLDNTPTHSYMKYLYKYPQSAFPYDTLIKENRRLRGGGPEFELLDTGVFDNNRYFDIVIEYAKIDAEDIAIRIEATNRGPSPAPLHVLPHLWFRNTWSWQIPAKRPPRIGKGDGRTFASLIADDNDVDPLPNLPIQYRLGPRVLYGPPAAALFTDNETNMTRVYGPKSVNVSRFVKDAIHRYVVGGELCVNPVQIGTKAALHYVFPAIAPGQTAALNLRLTPLQNHTDPLADVEPILRERRQEADAFYDALHPPRASAEERRVQRQALAGLLWTKQSYLFDVDVWLRGDFPEFPPPPERAKKRNVHWAHLNSMRILTVPDKWEYPWFAAWDLAFHCLPFALVDIAFAKDQLWFLLFDQFLHPNGQIPAYEWEFSDLNPPVHAWAVWRLYNMERNQTGKPDREFLERCFHKLLINFTWWINKVDREGNCIFEGGFLGLDNITVVDRSETFANGEVLEQADATGWMGMYCLTMMRIALELAKENHAYEGLAIKFFQHYVYVAHAMKHMGRRSYQLWDQQDHFFYDVLRHPDGRFQKFRVRSLVGLIPLFAVERLEDKWLERFPVFRQNVEWFLNNRQSLTSEVIHPFHENGRDLLLLTIVNRDQLFRLLDYIWREDEFLSPFGIRSLSKFHEQHPFQYAGKSVQYEPGDAASKIKGGNSNWRGPIWFPTNFLLIETFRKLGHAFGPDFEVPLSGGRRMSFPKMCGELAGRLKRLFLPDAAGRRPVFGSRAAFQNDPHWKNALQFYEFFHGDNGAGLGASHQTGWTALIATLIDEWRE
jgi:hypothetical protein